jgi:hypothetical protein
MHVHTRLHVLKCFVYIAAEYDSSPRNLLCTQIVWNAPEVFAHFALGKSAEGTFEVAHIGVVDIAHNRVADTSSHL